VITGLADPIVQGLNIRAGVQDAYSPARTGMAFGLGATLGGGSQLGLEALSRVGARWFPGGVGAGAPTSRQKTADAPGRVVPTGERPVSEVPDVLARSDLRSTFADFEALPGYRTSGHYPFASPPASFHYTFGEAAPSIASRGLNAGSYVTPTGNLSPLQAHIDLALPPNRGLPDALIRVDLEALRRDGYEIPAITRVGRSFGMPGGGYEMKFPYEIESRYIKVIKP
jgi:hypothetical protein